MKKLKRLLLQLLFVCELHFSTDEYRHLFQVAFDNHQMFDLADLFREIVDRYQEILFNDPSLSMRDIDRIEADLIDPVLEELEEIFEFLPHVN